MSKYTPPNKRTAAYVVPNKREESATIVMTDASFPTLGKAVTATKSVMNYKQEVVQGEQKRQANLSEQSMAYLLENGWILRTIPTRDQLAEYLPNWYDTCVGDGKWDYSDDIWQSFALDHYEIESIPEEEPEDLEEEPEDDADEDE